MTKRQSVFDMKVSKVYPLLAAKVFLLSFVNVYTKF